MFCWTRNRKKAFAAGFTVFELEFDRMNRWIRNQDALKLRVRPEPLNKDSIEKVILCRG
jgi:hypothetical protein